MIKFQNIHLYRGQKLAYLKRYRKTVKIKENCLISILVEFHHYSRIFENTLIFFSSRMNRRRKLCKILHQAHFFPEGILEVMEYKKFSSLKESQGHSEKPDLDQNIKFRHFEFNFHVPNYLPPFTISSIRSYYFVKNI